jgi:hypothetical protein
LQSSIGIPKDIFIAGDEAIEAYAESLVQEKK